MFSMHFLYILFKYKILQTFQVLNVIIFFFSIQFELIKIHLYVYIQLYMIIY